MTYDKDEARAIFHEKLLAAARIASFQIFGDKTFDFPKASFEAGTDKMLDELAEHFDHPLYDEENPAPLFRKSA